MDWRDWELFCEVVDRGGFSAAARALDHPKSSLSAAVQRLEGSLGVRLIERTTRHVRLTDAGNTIYQRARPLFLALHETRDQALSLSGVIAGTLRIKSPYEFGAHHAGPVACELMSRYPDLRIRIDVEHDLVHPVAENYDIVLAMVEAPLTSAGIVIKKVYSLERGLFAAPSLLQEHGEPRTIEELRRLPLITGPSDTPWALTTPHGETEHIELDSPRLTSSNANIRLQAALAGHGVLRVTASYTQGAVKNGSLCRLLSDHACEPLTVHALLPARQFVPSKVRCFLDALEMHSRREAQTAEKP
ncbi:hypothetical protein AC630_14805 [Bradyrhizobium sp. AS23.2]|nr:hypothetical protein AC630_14805 [Bradyrhizobium sp. AS23.2]